MAGSTPPGNCGHSGEGAGSSGLRSSKDSSLPKYIPMEQEDCENTKETISRLTRADVCTHSTVLISEPCCLEMNRRT